MSTPIYRIGDTNVSKGVKEDTFLAYKEVGDDFLPIQQGYSRTGSCWVMKKSGDIVEVPSDVPPVDFMDSLEGEYWLFAGGDNLNTQSHDVTAWSSLNIDNTPGNGIFYETTTNGSHIAYRDISITSGVSITAWGIIKPLQDDRNVRLADLGGSNTFIVSDVDGNIVAQNFPNGGGGIVRKLTDGSLYLSITYTSIGTLARIGFYSTIDNTTSFAGNPNKGWQVKHLGVDEDIQPRGLIKTSGQIGSANSSQLTLDFRNQKSDNRNLTFHVQLVKYFHNVSGDQTLVFEKSDGADQFRVWCNSSGNPGSGVLVTPNVGGYYSPLMYFDLSNTVIRVSNGSITTFDETGLVQSVTAADWISQSGSVLETITQIALSSADCSRLKRADVYDTALTDAECLSLLGL